MKTKIFILSSFLLVSITGWSQRVSKVSKNEGIRFSLDSILVQSDSFYFHLSLKNKSVVGYTPAFIRFYIRDRHVAKRTAAQEKEVVPTNKAELSEVESDSVISVMIVTPAFTIAKTKELVIEVDERNGARTMILSIRGHRLLKMVRRL